MANKVRAMDAITLRACAPLAMATWLLYKAFRHRRAVPPPPAAKRRERLVTRAADG